MLSYRHARQRDSNVEGHLNEKDAAMTQLDRLDESAFARWLAVHRPPHLPGDDHERFAALMAWQRQLYDAGWLGWGWPKEYGGMGGSVTDRLTFYRSLAVADSAFPPTLVGLDVVAPVLAERGNDEQRQRFLKPLLEGSEVWCQGFSEPDAGSDLASIRTTAHEHAGNYRLNGQKIWTSTAHHSQWCLVLARTEPGSTRHRGLSMLLVDLSDPGVTVRPIELINGDLEFGEIFFDNVMVPDSMVLGSPGDGWSIAMATLVHERSVYPVRRHAEVRRALNKLVALIRDAPGSSLNWTSESTALLERLGRAETLVEAMGAQVVRAAYRLENGVDPFESSVDKLMLALTEQEVMGLAISLLAEWSTTSPESQSIPGSEWLHDYQYALAGSVYGGSSEIQRTIIAEKMLGLERA
jgi:alkylation response protein AidB-like acyl-CoA dehydrogenase